MSEQVRRLAKRQGQWMDCAEKGKAVKVWRCVATLLCDGCYDVAGLHEETEQTTGGKMEVMTQGFNERVVCNFALAQWGIQARGRINRNGGTPDFVVGRPGARQEIAEDGGRTLVLPLPENAPKCYATLNEMGGVTLLLADEY